MLHVVSDSDPLHFLCSLVPRPIPSFSMFHAEKTGGPGICLYVLNVTNASKMINVGVTNRNTRWKFCSSRFDQLYTTKRLQLYDIALPRLRTEGRWIGRQHFNTSGAW